MNSLKLMRTGSLIIYLGIDYVTPLDLIINQHYTVNIDTKYSPSN